VSAPSVTSAQLDQTAVVNAIAHSTGIASLVASVYGVFGYLPIIITCVAGVFAAGSYAVTLWESITIQQWVAHKTMARRHRKMARLRRKQEILAAKISALDTIKAAQVEARNMVVDAQAKSSGDH